MEGRSLAADSERAAVVALSGGQDSGTCLYWAKKRFRDVVAVSFDYGQRHRIELESASRLAIDAGVERQVFPVPVLEELGGASLTETGIATQVNAVGTGNTFAAERGLPSSFVPGRNLILLGTAAAFGLPRGFDVLVTGVCEEDAAGYPDCRGEFVRLLEQTIRVGMDAPDFEVAAPLLNRTKAETWKLADDLGVLNQVVDLTHTCYEGDHSHRHPWGFGCGECPACQTRAEGFEKFRTTRWPKYATAH